MFNCWRLISSPGDSDSRPWLDNKVEMLLRVTWAEGSYSIVQGSELFGVVILVPAIRYSIGDYHSRPRSSWIWGRNFKMVRRLGASRFPTTPCHTLKTTWSISTTPTPSLNSPHLNSKPSLRYVIPCSRPIPVKKRPPSKRGYRAIVQTGKRRRVGLDSGRAWSRSRLTCSRCLYYTVLLSETRSRRRTGSIDGASHVGRASS
jgi:hypothetical protein